MKRLIIIAILVGLVASSSQALLLYTNTLLDTSGSTGNVTGSWVQTKATNGVGQQHAFALSVTRNGADGDETCDVKIQVSDDCTTAYDLPNGSFTQVGTSSVTDYKVFDENMYDMPACVRAVVTLGGTTPDYDIELTWIHD